MASGLSRWDAALRISAGGITTAEDPRARTVATDVEMRVAVKAAVTDPAPSPE